MISTKVLRLLAASIALAGSCSAVSAADPFGVRLLRPDSLHGWEHGAKPPENWTISQGRLTGNEQSTSLLSGWTFGDFELRFRWGVNPLGEIRVGLPVVPAGLGLQVSFHESGGECGEVRDGSGFVAAGAKLDPSLNGTTHSASMWTSGTNRP